MGALEPAGVRAPVPHRPQGRGKNAVSLKKNHFACVAQLLGRLQVIGIRVEFAARVRDGT
jgi:hypothetical protein